MDRSPQILTAIGLGVESHITPSSAAATAPTAVSIRRRRNGLTPACEPCRKAKVRCDTSPLGALCSRCRKRKTPDQCIFLEAPMTKQFRSVSHDPGTSLPSPKSPSQSSGAVEISPYNPFSTPISGRGAGRIRACPSGFLGSTSFSATINEHEDEAANDAEESEARTVMDPASIAMGVNILKVLPSRVDCQNLLGRYLESPGEVDFLKPSMKNMLDSLFATYQPYLREPRKDSELEKLSEAITRSSAVLFIPPEDAIGWMGSFAGPNTRWESIGILLNALATGLLSLPDREFGFLGVSLVYSDKKKGVLALKESIEWCLELCKHTLNTLMCSLLYKNLLLETVLYGDSSKLNQPWSCGQTLTPIKTYVFGDCTTTL